MDVVQTPLAAAGDPDYLVGLSGTAFGDQRAGARGTRVLPGGLDEQAAGVAGAGFGDRALATVLPGLVERGDEPEPASELARFREAVEVADLECERERGQGVRTCSRVRQR